MVGLVPEWEKKAAPSPVVVGRGVVAKPAGRGRSEDATTSDESETKPAAVKASVEADSTKGANAEVAAKKDSHTEDAKPEATPSAHTATKAASTETAATAGNEAMPAAAMQQPVVAGIPVAIQVDTDELPIAAETPVAGVGIAAKGSKAPVEGVATKPPAKKLEKSDAVAVGETKSTDAVSTIAVAPPTLSVVTHSNDSAAVAGVAIGGTVHGAHGAVAATTSAAKTAEVTASAKVADTSTAGTDLKTLVATPNVLEVGIASGTHGWLRVRAELGQMGEVTASVAAASAGAAEGLHKELPAISAYLAGERVGVSSLVVNAMEKGAGAQDAAMNNGAGAQTGTNTGTNSGTSQRGQGSTAGKAQAVSGAEGVSDEGTAFDFGLSGVNLPAAVFANGSGSWLSVRV